MENSVHILIGSNIGDRSQYLAEARRLLGVYLGNIELASQIYESEAWGTDAHQAAYLNQALSIHAQGSPGQLVNTSLAIEKMIGRKRTVPNAARIIDIDVLFAGDEIYHSPSTCVPHPRLHLRRFVLTPLAEISPNFLHPILKLSVVDLLKQVDDDLAVTPLS